MSESFPLKELRTLLNKAKAVDKYCYQFGAKSHQYQWNPPASVEEVEEFERENRCQAARGVPRFFCYWQAMAVQDLIMACFSLQKILYWVEDNMDPKKRTCVVSRNRDTTGIL